MATDRQTAANRANAAHSTGPKTPEGKANSRFNRLTHGLDSPAPVVPGEDPAAWAAHRDGIVRSLAPVGPLEAELADRAALLFWRLRRVARYETAAATATSDHAVGLVTGEAGLKDPPPGSVAGVRARLDEHRAQLGGLVAQAALARDLLTLPEDHPLPAPIPGLFLAGVADDECPEVSSVAGVLADLDLPDPAWDDLAGWDGWTPRTVRAGLAEVARQTGQTPAQVLARAGRRLARAVADQQDEVTRAEDALARAEAEQGAAVERARELNLVPTGATDKVVRYEAHLSRQLTQTLQLLDRFQAARVAGRLRPVAGDAWDPGLVPAVDSADRTQPPAERPPAAVATPGGTGADSADRTQSAPAGSPVPSVGRSEGSADRTRSTPVMPSVGAAGRCPAAARRFDPADQTQLADLLAEMFPAAGGPGPFAGRQNGTVNGVR